MRNGWELRMRRGMRMYFWYLSSSLLLTDIYRYVSELLYIHTKLMIVDDKKVIVSASFVYSTDSCSDDTSDGLGEHQ
jgi:hypothetical protein